MRQQNALQTTQNLRSGSMKLIIASNNKGKIREYKDIFEPFGFEVCSQGEENIRRMRF